MAVLIPESAVLGSWWSGCPSFSPLMVLLHLLAAKTTAARQVAARGTRLKLHSVRSLHTWSFEEAPHSSVVHWLEILYGSSHWLPSVCSCCGVAMVTSTALDKTYGGFLTRAPSLVDAFVSTDFMVAPVVASPSSPSPPNSLIHFLEISDWFSALFQNPQNLRWRNSLHQQHLAEPQAGPPAH